VARIETELNVPAEDPGIIVDLLLSYRAVKDYAAMVGLVGKMSPALARSVMVREQFGFALNRIGEHEKAEKVLEAIVEDRHIDGVD
jgi:hypothetical protein